jgi:hypothetical protein
VKCDFEDCGKPSKQQHEYLMLCEVHHACIQNEQRKIDRGEIEENESLFLYQVKKLLERLGVKGGG